MKSKTFKNFSLYISMMLCVAAFHSCGNDDPRPEPVNLTVSPAEIQIRSDGLTASGASATFSVTTNAESWTASVGASASSWLTINPTSGKAGVTEVTITAGSTGQAREGGITVTAGDKEEEITVKQLAPEVIPATLNVEPEEITVDAEGLLDGNSPTIVISTNKYWIFVGVPDWIEPDILNGPAGENITVTLAIDDNFGEERSATFQIAAADIEKDITVTQSASDATITVEPEDITVDFEGLLGNGNTNSPSIVISTNKSWTVEDLPGWITANPSSGAAGEYMTVTLAVSENETAEERSATFRVRAGNTGKPVTLTQSGSPYALNVAGYVSWMIPMSGVANGTANTDVGQFWVKSDDGGSILRGRRAGGSGSSTATMSYVTSNSASGDYILLYAMMKDDYWQMEIPTTGLAAGTTLKIEGEMQSSATGPGDFLFQYSSDQSTWMPINAKTDGDITYTVQMLIGEAPGYAVTKTPINETFTIASAIPAGTFYIRLLISSTWRCSRTQANISTAGTSRIARPQYTGDADKLPIMKVTKL